MATHGLLLDTAWLPLWLRYSLLLGTYKKKQVFANHQSARRCAQNHQRVASRMDGGALDEQPTVSAQGIDRIHDFSLWYQHIVGIPALPCSGDVVAT